MEKNNINVEGLIAIGPNEIQWKTLGEAAVIGTGSDDTQDTVENGNYTFYARGPKLVR